jgi:hypothetical protein
MHTIYFVWKYDEKATEEALKHLEMSQDIRQTNAHDSMAEDMLA